MQKHTNCENEMTKQTCKQFQTSIALFTIDTRMHTNTYTHTQTQMLQYIIHTDAHQLKINPRLLVLTPQMYNTPT